MPQVKFTAKGEFGLITHTRRNRVDWVFNFNAAKNLLTI